MTNSFNLEESRNSWSKTSQVDLDLEHETVKKSPNYRWGLVIALAAIAIVGLAIGLALQSTDRNRDSNSDNIPSEHQRQQNTITTETTHQMPNVQWPVRIGNLTIDKALEFSLGVKLTWTHENNDTTSSGSEPVVCLGNESNICLEWQKDLRLSVRLTTDNKLLVDCYEIEWTALNCVSQVLTDCFNVTSSHWYGGYEDTNQLWPFERNAMNSSDYLSHDGFWPVIGNVLERYWISSSGPGIFVDNNVPLYFSLNRPQLGTMCLTAKFNRYPYHNLNNKFPYLKYTICDSRNIKVTHTAMSAMFIPRPTGTPHADLFRYPIWSTWAQYHKEINQTSVLQYARDIRNNNFSCAQVEIDEKWTPVFGDLFFDVNKFPNATAMVDEIKQLGLNVTVWVPPFFENIGNGYKEAEDKDYLVRQFESDHVILTKWWDGNNSGILDVSNPAAVDWFLAKLAHLKSEYHVDSFKFDAGEMTWLPTMYSVYNTTENPSDLYPREYVKMATKADDNYRQEVRSGYRNQDCPIFFRQIDKLSEWTGPGSLETIIPGVLTFGIIGYPFVLPDMVGGNAYGNQPDSELYIRWMELNVFLPGLQLSIVPWVYNDSVVDIVRHMLELHTQVSDVFIQLAQDAVQTGGPIIRPLWWIDAENETALTVNDQFLVGDRYLVAPVIRQGARSRDIYIPSGDWLDMLQGNGTEWVTGPIVVYNYSVPLESLAYFENVKYRN